MKITITIDPPTPVVPEHAVVRCEYAGMIIERHWQYRHTFMRRHEYDTSIEQIIDGVRHWQPPSGTCSLLAEAELGQPDANPLHHAVATWLGRSLPTMLAVQAGYDAEQREAAAEWAVEVSL